MSATPLPERPSWCDGLLRDVDAAFAVIGAETPGWPDPHPDRNPSDEEYSRCLDPGKYRIIESRLEAWAQVLRDQGIAVVDTTNAPATEWIGGHARRGDPARLMRLSPAVEDGLSLLVRSSPAGAGLPARELAVASTDRAPVVVELLPDCGCDACDSGSADLLEQVDGWVLTVARGGVVHARRGDESATRTLDGWQATGRIRSPETWLDGSSRAPEGVVRWRGAPWLT